MSDPAGQNPFGQGLGPQDGAGQLPPFQPPSGPPGAGQGWQAAPPPKKKRWPWVLAGFFVLCFLPLGGCIALAGFGLNEINKIGDEIDGVVDTMFADASSGNFAAASSAADNEGGCVRTGDLEEQLIELAPTGGLVILNTDFVRRSGNSSLGNLGTEESETFVVDGREDQGAADVTGSIDTAEGTRRFQALLVDGNLGWQVCELNLS